MFQAAWEHRLSTFLHVREVHQHCGHPLPTVCRIYLRHLCALYNTHAGCRQIRAGPNRFFLLTVQPFPSLHGTGKNVAAPQIEQHCILLGLKTAALVYALLPPPPPYTVVQGGKATSPRHESSRSGWNTSGHPNTATPADMETTTSSPRKQVATPTNLG